MLQGGDPASGSRDRAYAAARRHSGRVRMLKVGIPVGSALAAALVVTATWFNPFGRFPGLTLGPISVAGTRIAMENPRLTGFRKDSRPYEVTAKAAYQDVRRPGMIELSQMQGRLALDDRGASATLAAEAGLFDTAKEQLELSRNIRITTSAGEVIALRSASADFKAGTIVSREPLTITTASGVIEAEGVHVSENGRVVSFTGRVRTQFRRDLAEPAVTSSTEPASTDTPAAAGPPARMSQAEAAPR